MFHRLRQKLFPPKGTRLYQIKIKTNLIPTITVKGRYRSDAEAINVAVNNARDLFGGDAVTVNLSVWRGGSCVWNAKGELHDRKRLDFSTEHFVAGD